MSGAGSVVSAPDAARTAECGLIALWIDDGSGRVGPIGWSGPGRVLWASGPVPGSSSVKELTVGPYRVEW